MRAIFLLLLMIISTSSYSLNGQPQDSVYVPLPNIKEANQIYHYQLHRIQALEGITQAQAKENRSLALMAESCMAERELSDAIINNLYLQVEQKDIIIGKQSTMIKILYAVTAASVTYTVYRQLK